MTKAIRQNGKNKDRESMARLLKGMGRRGVDGVAFSAVPGNPGWLDIEVRASLRKNPVVAAERLHGLPSDGAFLLRAPGRLNRHRGIVPCTVLQFYLASGAVRMTEALWTLGLAILDGQGLECGLCAVPRAIDGSAEEKNEWVAGLLSMWGRDPDWKLPLSGRSVRDAVVDLAMSSGESSDPDVFIAQDAAVKHLEDHLGWLGETELRFFWSGLGRAAARRSRALPRETVRGADLRDARLVNETLSREPGSPARKALKLVLKREPARTRLQSLLACGGYTQELSAPARSTDFENARYKMDAEELLGPEVLR